MPRWVKVSLLAVGGIVLLAVILTLAGVGDHGPMRHMPGGGAPTTSAPERGDHNPGVHD